MQSFNLLGLLVWPCIGNLQKYRQKGGLQIYVQIFQTVEFDFISFFATLCFMDFLFPRWGFFDILSCFSFLFLLHISQLKSCTILTIFNDKYVVAELLYCDIGNIYRKFSRDIIEQNISLKVCLSFHPHTNYLGQFFLQYRLYSIEYQYRCSMGKMNTYYCP